MAMEVARFNSRLYSPMFNHRESLEQGPLQRLVPQTHRLYPIIQEIDKYSYSAWLHCDEDFEIFKEMISLTKRVFNLSWKVSAEEKVIRHLHQYVSKKIFFLLDRISSEIECKIDRDNHLYENEKYITVYYEMQYLIDSADLLYPIVKKHPPLPDLGFPDRTFPSYARSVEDLESRITAYRKVLPPPLVIRFFESLGDFLCCTSSRKKSYRHYSSYSRSSSTSLSSQNGLLDTQRKTEESRNRMWENKVDMHRRSQANYSLNLSRNLQSQRIQHNNTMRFHSHR